ncbi:hypothetical protein P4H71_06875 [Paenibacillus kribbensis]|uniref:hypothetical protein n=1 Tax=Paenibacillus kribbensis TaxID=172713 RepID=UPI002DBA712E|nr:hypothetical protein [Paenibacillus kribbensis]MEC0234053.1 hypothetical protein [Paenibacillus kribbensis]
MRLETSMLAKDHMEYIKLDEAHAAHMRTFDTIYDHFYYYLTTVRGLLSDTAQGIVDDFKSDLMSQPDLDE